ncbi:root hair defective 3 GTP-binding protein-domain-containing protein [Thamnocephalis sphaerospora]|uniref:Root hair defective 3 GTP-binding protein-domain-containing protein n=1 Tax=Thamnocephalis sphaerospora TaxID=78915 RepID=A0A4P9XJH9_9FUNG|nr:root hair defective 3 GTP-binding protein-domain-containing protein [Thamnocephalis sphaerospora]|eukprot:RKP05908.1 root hair defective 3 GTP-binding protein-domain-containing protein [Thamnocephalis sphaerospora]
MARIWEDIAKPECLKNSLFSEFFDCMVVGLPPKPFSPDQFNEAVNKLRLRFTDPNHSDYVFKPCYHRGIPIDGFSHYASGIWDAVLADDMLSIPSQQMLLAEYRCAELRSEASTAFKSNISAITAQINDGKTVDGLGKLMEKARNEAIAIFDANAKHYHHDVYTGMRSKLYETFNEQLSILFRNQLDTMAANLAEQFDTEVGSLRASSAALFTAKADRLRLRALGNFEKAAKDMLIKGTDWAFSKELELLHEKLSKKALHYCNENASRLQAEEDKRRHEERLKQEEERRRKEMENARQEARMRSEAQEKQRQEEKRQHEKELELLKEKIRLQEKINKLEQLRLEKEMRQQMEEGRRAEIRRRNEERRREETVRRHREEMARQQEQLRKLKEEERRKEAQRKEEEEKRRKELEEEEEARQKREADECEKNRKREMIENIAVSAAFCAGPVTGLVAGGVVALGKLLF